MHLQWGLELGLRPWNDTLLPRRLADQQPPPPQPPVPSSASPHAQECLLSAKRRGKGWSRGSRGKGWSNWGIMGRGSRGRRGTLS